MSMNYSARYPGLFGGARSGVKPKVEPKSPPKVEVKPEVKVEPVPPELDEVVLAENVLTLAQELADDYTVPQLKEMADERGVSYKSNIKEMDLAVLIAEFNLNQGV